MEDICVLMIGVSGDNVQRCQDDKGVPGQLLPRQEAGGQAKMALVKSPSDALTAVAPSSQAEPADNIKLI